MGFRRAFNSKPPAPTRDLGVRRRVLGEQDAGHAVEIGEARHEASRTVGVSGDGFQFEKPAMKSTGRASVDIFDLRAAGSRATLEPRGSRRSASRAKRRRGATAAAILRIVEGAVEGRIHGLLDEAAWCFRPMAHGENEGEPSASSISRSIFIVPRHTHRPMPFSSGRNRRRASPPYRRTTTGLVSMPSPNLGRTGAVSPFSTREHPHNGCSSH